MSKSKGTKGKSAEEIAHYTAILVEDLKDQFKFVTEYVSSTEERWDKKLKEEFAKRDSRLEVIEGAVTQHSRTLNEHSRILDEHTQILDEHTQILNDHSRVLDDHTQILNKHTQLLLNIDSKLDHVVEKIEQHDQDIRLLKVEVFPH